MEWKIASALEKIFPDGRGLEWPAPKLTALRGETVSFQIALKGDGIPPYLWPKMDSPLADHATLRRVESVPVRMARTQENADEGYLSFDAGLYPDVLTFRAASPVILPAGQWRALFVEIDVPINAAPGPQPIAVSFLSNEGECFGRAETEICVLPAQLPPQRTIHTEWFHADCLADFYHVPALSERHWEIIENFVKTAARRGINMLLTPHVTPALDTRVGGERTTVQLVKIKAENGRYSFDFSLLKRWVDMAARCGIQYFELAHLFSQWGAKAAPKVMVEENGVVARRFGWDTPAVGGEYTRFLHQYLPALTAQLRAWGIADRCYFHISDEPTGEQLADYRAAKESVAALLQGFPIMDALSDHDVFRVSGIETPVVSVAHLDTFMEKKVSPLWGYYCCGPTKIFTNRFIQMPLARTRALGFMIWKYRLQGFLHWGFNFYNTVQSVAPVNPYLDAESGGIFPAGDPFVVYPGSDGKPEESIRLTALHAAFQDVRALELLESLTNRETALRAMEEAGEITLTKYPNSSPALLAVRENINRAIERALS